MRRSPPDPASSARRPSSSCRSWSCVRWSCSRPSRCRPSPVRASPCRLCGAPAPTGPPRHAGGPAGRRPAPGRRTCSAASGLPTEEIATPSPKASGPEHDQGRRMRSASARRDRSPRGRGRGAGREEREADALQHRGERSAGRCGRARRRAGPRPELAFGRVSPARWSRQTPQSRNAPTSAAHAGATHPAVLEAKQLLFARQRRPRGAGGFQRAAVRPVDARGHDLAELHGRTVSWPRCRLSPGKRGRSPSTARPDTRAGWSAPSSPRPTPTSSSAGRSAEKLEALRAELELEAPAKPPGSTIPAPCATCSPTARW